MMWLLSIYLVALIFFAANPEKIFNIKLFRISWVFFSVIPVLFFCSRLYSIFIEAVGVRLVLAKNREYGSNVVFEGLAGLFLALSLLFLLNAVLPKNSGRSSE